jgi:multidrug resistance efflux pump
MAVGNGDERQQAAWERVETKLDRLDEKVDRLDEKVDRQEKRFEVRFDRLERFAETAELRLKRLEDNGELLRLLIQAVRHEADEKNDKLKAELLSGFGTEVRIELLAAQSLNDTRVSKLERRVDALEAAKA